MHNKIEEEKRLEEEDKKEEDSTGNTIDVAFADHNISIDVLEMDYILVYGIHCLLHRNKIVYQNLETLV